MLLSAAAFAGALAGYARSAYADPNCSPDTTPSGPTVTCSGGPFIDPELIDNSANTDESLAVSTTAPFQVNTTSGDALTITGFGAVSFIDTYAGSYLDSSGAATPDALRITSNGDTTGPDITLGGVEVETSGTLIGSYRGIDARNYGGAALTIETNGNVTGVGAHGIYVWNVNGSNFEVTTGVGTTVMGAYDGIYAHNFVGDGTNTITTNGNVMGGLSGLTPTTTEAGH